MICTAALHRRIQQERVSHCLNNMHHRHAISSRRARKHRVMVSTTCIIGMQSARPCLCLSVVLSQRHASSACNQADRASVLRLHWCCFNNMQSARPCLCLSPALMLSQRHVSSAFNISSSKNAYRTVSTTCIIGIQFLLLHLLLNRCTASTTCIIGIQYIIQIRTRTALSQRHVSSACNISSSSSV